MSLNHLVLNGLADVDLEVKSLVFSSVSAPSAAATPVTINNSKCAVASFSGVSINAGLTSNVVVNSNLVTSSSQVVMCCVSNVSGNASGSGFIVQKFATAAGTITFTLQNPTATNSGSSTVSILYMLLN